jgi:hypothetical protein
VARRIIIGVVLTLLLLTAVRRLTTGRPADLVVEAEGMKLRHRTVTEQVGPGQPTLIVRVEPAQRLGIVVRWITPHSAEVKARSLVLVTPDTYAVHLPDLGKGARMRYWIAATNVEQTKARIPEDPDKLVLLKYKERASQPVVVAHVAFMFGAFFCMVMSLFGAIRILRGLEGKRSTIRAARWVLVFSFIGACPLGLLLNYQTFGVLWEGYPFGRDITDNKTQVMFVLWLVCLLLVRGSFVGGGEEKDRLGARAFAWAIVASFILSLALFILPHSI